jgi:hypothetical protein
MPFVVSSTAQFFRPSSQIGSLNICDGSGTNLCRLGPSLRIGSLNIVDQFHFAVLPWPEGAGVTPTTEEVMALNCTQSEIDAAESLFIQYLRPKPSYEQVLQRLKQTCRQYALAVGPNGHILLYLNAFPGDRLNSAAAIASWRDQWITSPAGGSEFFHCMIDLTDKRILSFRVNDGVLKYGAGTNAALALGSEP